MRNIELLLKFAFVASAAIVFMLKDMASPWSCVFLVVSLVLGIVLIFNKKASYNFTQSSKDLILRRIEGVLLIIVAVAGLYVKLL